MGILNIWNKLISLRNIKVNYLESNNVRVMYKTRLDYNFEQVVNSKSIDSDMEIVEDKLFNAESFGLISIETHPLEGELSSEAQQIAEEKIKLNQQELINKLNPNFILKELEVIKIKSADGLGKYRALVYGIIDVVSGKYVSVYHITIISAKAIVFLKVYNKFSPIDEENIKVFSEINFLLSGLAVF
ncbi:MAG: hypothetical protein MUF58_05025 [Arcicella sp.]|jgi:hypothetical protein|nr:hypothetical protein [Arcicella sp.]